MPNDTDRQTIFSAKSCNQFTTMKVKDTQPELTASVTINTTKLANFQVSFRAADFGGSPTAPYTPQITNFNSGSLLSSQYRAFDGKVATSSSYQERTFTYDISQFKNYDQIFVTVTDNDGDPLNLSNGDDAVTTVKCINIRNANDISLSYDTPNKSINNTSETFSYTLGVYSIKNSSTLQYLDALADTQGTGLSTASKSQNASQYWKIKPSNGGLQFVPMSNQEYVLDLMNAWDTENNTVNIGPKTAYVNAQTWAVTNLSDEYKIRPLQSASRYLSSPLSAGGRPVISSVDSNKLKWDFTLYQRGDVNCDGVINTIDLQMILSYLQNNLALNNVQKYLSDSDGDGTISYTDFTMLNDIVMAE